MSTAEAPYTNWLVQGPDVASEAVDRRLEAETEVRGIRRIARDVRLVTMTADRARRLKSEFVGIIVEPDAEVDPFGG